MEWFFPRHFSCTHNVYTYITYTNLTLSAFCIKCQTVYNNSTKKCKKVLQDEKNNKLTLKERWKAIK